MVAFPRWFNPSDGTHLVMKSGIAHLWFVTIHPFDDGNGRIARTLADLLLARSEETSQRFYSMSAQIQAKRTEYYRLLEATQKATWISHPGCPGFLIVLAEPSKVRRASLLPCWRRRSFGSGITRLS